MNRYRVAPPRRPTASVTVWPDDRTVVPDLTVFEPSDRWQDTGLVDRDGYPLQRDVGPAPIGFLTFEDAA